jgi:hypothetical protein
VSELTDGTLRTEELSKSDGIWCGPQSPRRKGLSAALSTEQIDLWNFAERRARLPRWIRPQLAQLVNAAPKGDLWLHEIKNDDCRIACAARPPHGQAVYAHGLDWTHKVSDDREGRDVARCAPGLSWGKLCRVGPDGVTPLNIVQLASDRGNAVALVFSCSIFSTSTKISARGHGSSAKRASLPCCPVHLRRCTAASDHQIGHGRAFHQKVCRGSSRLSSPSAPTRPMRQAIVACG